MSNNFLQSVIERFGKKTDRREILDEDEYLKRYEKIIQRDYYPHLINNDSESEEESEEETLKNENESVVKTDTSKMSINEFLSKFVSEDDKSFSEIAEKDKLGFIAKNIEMFKGLGRGDAPKFNTPQIGYSMPKLALQNHNKSKTVLALKGSTGNSQQVEVFENTENCKSEFLEKVNKKYSTNTMNQNDNAFIISKLQNAIGYNGVSKLSDVQYASKKILKDNTNLKKYTESKTYQSESQSYFQMSTSMVLPSQTKNKMLPFSSAHKYYNGMNKSLF